MKIAGYEIEEPELREFIENELEVHEYIFREVKDYVDDIIHKSFEIDPNELKMIDAPTYIAIILELTRTIYINLVNYLKYQSYKKKYESGKQWRYTQH